MNNNNKGKHMRYIVFSRPVGGIEQLQLATDIASINKTIENAFERYNSICLHNTKLIAKLDFQLVDCHEKSLITYFTTKFPYVEKVRLIISFQMPLDNPKDPFWVLNNSIHFVIKCKVDADYIEQPKFVESSEGYNAYTCTNFVNLEQLVLDVMIDMGVEYKLLLSEYKLRLDDYSFMDAISNRKASFLKVSMGKEISEEQAPYICFSSFFRSAENSFEYDLSGILQCWTAFLLELSGLLLNFPKISEVEDLIRFLSSEKQHGGLPLKSLKASFREKCIYPGFYLYVWLRKSVIGTSKDRKVSVQTILGGKGDKVNRCTIIPFTYFYVLNNVKDLLSYRIFELVKKEKK